MQQLKLNGETLNISEIFKKLKIPTNTTCIHHWNRGRNQYIMAWKQNMKIIKIEPMFFFI